MEKHRWTLLLESNASVGSRIVLLAPISASIAFSRVFVDGARHQRLLSSAQQLRGRIYLRDAAIKPLELSAAGLHIQAADALSWHVLTIDQHETVTGCLRYRQHEMGMVFSKLCLSRSPIAESLRWGPLVPTAIQAQINSAARCRLSYVELGGWGISEALRRRADAIRMVLSVYALARITGGALAVTTATERHNSASILRRMGAGALCAPMGWKCHRTLIQITGAEWSC
jgi:hypothetical protein